MIQFVRYNPTLVRKVAYPPALHQTHCFAPNAQINTFIPMHMYFRKHRLVPRIVRNKKNKRNTVDVLELKLRGRYYEMQAPLRTCRWRNNSGAFHVPTRLLRSAKFELHMFLFH